MQRELEDGVPIENFNTELELSELEAFILEHEDTLGSAEASANQMVEQTR